MEVVRHRVWSRLRIHYWTGCGTKKRRAKNDSNQGSELSNKKNGTAISGDCEGQGWSLAQGKIRSLRWTSKRETVQRAKREMAVSRQPMTELETASAGDSRHSLSKTKVQVGEKGPKLRLERPKGSTSYLQESWGLEG